MSNLELENLVEPVCDITHEAGRSIMEIYRKLGAVRTKSDGSPVTEADRKAHRLIAERLRALTPNTPILSEESAQAPYAERQYWSEFWLVDPLDGTREFIDQRGEFTVNIALVRNGDPVLGVVGIPAKDLIYRGHDGGGAYRQRDDAAPERIHVAHYRSGSPVVVASRSHSNTHTAAFIEQVKKACGGCALKSLGSALKICLVAEGEADVYPRLGPTSEWDIAAAHCLLRAAGGRLTTARGAPIRYNKENVLNPWFVAAGESDFDWISLTRGLADTSVD
ncbi:MAG: 3'(2'),5'-bisphosphate nucleotidase CysQ [Gammaproteobacteria bacterium]|nr:3'(2'),5'-bisphosphate nucleotidase CysQ [Gammaproteobacteria bacterium]